MKKLAAIDEKVTFKKQVPVHPRDRLRKLSKKPPKGYAKKGDKRLKHPKDRMKSEEDQIDRDNVSKLIRGEFDFSPKKMLSKTLILDTTKIDEIMDLINGPLNDEIK